MNNQTLAIEKQIVILCHLERLPHFDDGINLAFSMNLSIGIGGEFTRNELTSISSLLMPWLADPIKEVKAFYIASNGELVKLPEPITNIHKRWRTKLIDDLRRKPVGNQSLSAYLSKTLKADFDEILKSRDDSKLFQWSGLRSGQTLEENIDEDSTDKPWNVLIGQAGQLPTPIPQLLNLSLIFRVAAPAGTTVFAAPVLKFPGITVVPADNPTPGDTNSPITTTNQTTTDTNATNPATPADSQSIQNQAAANPITDFAGFSGVKKWKYQIESGSVPGNFPIYAYVKGKSSEKYKDAPFLDLNTLWVKSPGNNYGEDWRATLEEKMAYGADLSRRLIESLYEIVQPEVPKQAPGESAACFNLRNQKRIAQQNDFNVNMPIFRQMFLALLRDQIGIGVNKSPSGQSLLDSLLGRVTAASISSAVKSLKLETLSISEWQEMLRDNFSYLDKLKILSDVTASISEVEAITELEQLYQTVFEEKNLIVLLKAQWRKILPKLGAAEGAALTKSLLDRDLTEINVRRALAQENLGRFWSSFIKIPQTDDAGQVLIERNFSNLCFAYSLLRFQLSCSDVNFQIDECFLNQGQDCSGLLDLYENYKDNKPTPDFSLGSELREKELFWYLLNYIVRWSRVFAREELLPRNLTELAAQNTSTDIPHAISIMVDKLSADPALIKPKQTDPNQTDPKQPEEDYLQSISGIGVLMREVYEDGNASDWRCLTMADVHIRNEKNAFIKVFDDSDPLLVPYGLNYLNDLRQCLVIYNNHPITAISPTAGLMQKNKFTSTEDAIVNSLTRNMYSVAAAAKLTPLKYGSKYEVLPFIVGNSGAIPKELVPADGESFGDLDLDKFNKDYPKLKAALSKYVRKFNYQRRVKIGQIRAFNAQKGANGQIDPKGQIKLPVIPENVYPRIRDLGDKIGKAKVSGKEQDDIPLLVLTPSDKSKWEESKIVDEFSFYVRLPAIDIDPWDRWIASNRIYGEDSNPGQIKTLRKIGWAEFHKRTDKTATAARLIERELPTALNGGDPTIDDPSLYKGFHFELKQFNTRTSAFDIDVQGSPQIVDLEPANQLSLNQYRDVQSKSQMVVCKSGFTAVLNGSMVTLAEGNIYKLKISCLLPTEDYPKTAKELKRFAAIYSQIDEKGNIKTDLETVTRSENSKSYYKISSVELLIEVAKLEENIDLQALLSPQFPPGSDFITVNFSDRKFDFYYKAELLRQMWRWEGRNSKPYPFTDAELTVSDPAGWESVEYDSRDQNDYSVIEMKTVKTAEGSRQFSYKEQLSGKDEASGNEVKKELRALHYRFKARIYHRYEGFLKKELAVKNADIWKSLYIPCRLDESLSVPKLRFIFPLTQSFGMAENGSNSAGLLAVFSEPWYENAGVGEDLGGEITKVPDPNYPDGGTPNKFYFEIGPDPINTTEPMNFFDSDDKSVADFGKIIGPIGHSDNIGDSPIFTSTSFIIPAPHFYQKSAPQTLENLPDWGMCEIRFRRLWRKADKSFLTSAWTDPYWVQFLPEFTRFGKNNEITSDTHFLKLGNVNQPEVQLSIIDRQNNLETPLKTTEVKNAPHNSYELYLVLTSRVFDVIGRQGQEVFVGIAYPSERNPSTGEIRKWSIGNGTFAETDTLRARIIEVQRRVSAVSVNPDFKALAANLWKHLFSKNIPDNERARIVRVSEPFDIKN
jgi:hypothetical protein